MSIFCITSTTLSVAWTNELISSGDSKQVCFPQTRTVIVVLGPHISSIHPSLTFSVARIQMLPLPDKTVAITGPSFTAISLATPENHNPASCFVTWLFGPGVSAQARPV